MNPAERKRLVGILGRLGSDFDGERAAAGLLADRMLRTAGLTWEDVLPGHHAPQAPPAPAPAWRSDLALCRRHASFLRVWEQGFIGSCAARSSLTPRQRITLTEIAATLRARGRT